MGSMSSRESVTVDAEQPPRADIERLLVSVAREQFAEFGYADTSLASVVSAAGITKGAVYYYFANKRDLFAVVYEEEQRRVIRDVAVAYGQVADVWEAFQAGVLAFMRQLVDRGVQRIMLIDAPVALGWAHLRDGSSVTAVGMLADGLRRVSETGLLRGWDIDILAHLIYGAICESAHTIAFAGDPDKAVEPVADEVRALLNALVSSSSGSAALQAANAAKESD